MTEGHYMEKALYGATKSAILDFASHVTPETRSRMKEGLQRQAFKIVDENVQNLVLRAELKSLYRKVVAQRSVEKDHDEVCWRKYLLSQEHHKIPIDDEGNALIPINEQCLHCNKGPYGGTYESGDDQALIGFCGEHEPVKGKLEGKVEK
jgi:hypothetical protein